MALKNIKGEDMHPTDELIHINKEYQKIAGVHEYLFEQQEILDDFPAYKTLLIEIEEEMGKKMAEAKKLYNEHKKLNT
jgi:hypothetical protein